MSIAKNLTFMLLAIAVEVEIAMVKIALMEPAMLSIKLVLLHGQSPMPPMYTSSHKLWWICRLRSPPTLPVFLSLPLMHTCSSKP